MADKIFLYTLTMLSLALATGALCENVELRQRLSSSVKPEAVAAVADVCHDLVTVNRRCLAFSGRVKEMLDVRNDERTWAGLWDGEVLSGPDRARQGGPGDSR